MGTQLMGTLSMGTQSMGTQSRWHQSHAHASTANYTHQQPDGQRMLRGCGRQLMHVHVPGPQKGPRHAP